MNLNNNTVNNAARHYMTELARMSLARFLPDQVQRSDVIDIVVDYITFLEDNEQDVPFATDTTCGLAIELINWIDRGDNFSEYALGRLRHFREVAARRAFAARITDF